MLDACCDNETDFLGCAPDHPRYSSISWGPVSTLRSDLYIPGVPEERPAHAIRQGEAASGGSKRDCMHRIERHHDVVCRFGARLFHREGLIKCCFEEKDPRAESLMLAKERSRLASGKPIEVQVFRFYRIVERRDHVAGEAQFQLDFFTANAWLNWTQEPVRQADPLAQAIALANPAEEGAFDDVAVSAFVVSSRAPWRLREMRCQ